MTGKLLLLDATTEEETEEELVGRACKVASRSVILRLRLSLSAYKFGDTQDAVFNHFKIHVKQTNKHGFKSKRDY